MSIDATIKGQTKLRKDIKRISDDLVVNKILFNIGASVQKTILNDTNEGIDFKGRRFKGYKDSTKRQRAKRGRQVRHVDLQDRRLMLPNMTIKTDISRGNVKLFFRSNEQRKKAFFHTETGVGKDKTKREFFGISNRAEKDVIRLYDRYLGQVFK